MGSDYVAFCDKCNTRNEISAKYGWIYKGGKVFSEEFNNDAMKFFRYHSIAKGHDVKFIDDESLLNIDDYLTSRGMPGVRLCVKYSDECSLYPEEDNGA